MVKMVKMVLQEKMDQWVLEDMQVKMEPLEMMEKTGKKEKEVLLEMMERMVL